MARKSREAGKATADSGGAVARLPPVFPAEIIGRDKDGDLIARPLDWTDDEAPGLIVHTSRRDRFPPGIGDHVILKIDRIGNARDFGAIHARVLKTLAKRPQQVIGVFRAHGGGGGRLLPVDKKALGREITIGPNDTDGAEDGELIAVETIRESRLGLKTARVVERLGDVSSEKAASLIAIHMHGIPHVFPDAVLAEAEAVRPATLKGREDWRDLPLITIDPADAKDHDDAVHAASDEDPRNPGGFVLSIAIADVAAYVTPGSALDDEALTRGNSVYFPDRVVPMLPERISNDLCSLVPAKDRPAIAVRAVIGADGRKRSHGFHRIVMRSHAKLSYERAQAAIDGHADEETALLLDAVLRPLWAAYAALRKERTSREPLDLELPERKLVLDAEGKVVDVIIRERLDAHRLIEEMMILANVCAAETLIDNKQGLLFRIHDEPSLAKMEGLRAFLKTLDIDLPKGGAVRPALFNRTLTRLAESDHAPLINEMVLRSQSQAEYAPENIGHFGLNLRKYAHFTSPIRRYSDLVVHRALIRALDLGKDGGPETGLDRMRQIGQLISATERRAMLAERDTYDRLVAAHLKDQIGATFAGRVSGVTRAGLFVKLTKTGADGFVPAATLGADFYYHDEAAQALIGQRTGEAFRLGDTVDVRLAEAAPFAGALRFEILSKGRYMKPAAGKRGMRRRGGETPSYRKLGRQSRGR
ncbi:MAG: ribonuclease R [Methylocystis sp.]|nr:ribonuclease R [Methylocystis sp.]MCA3582123.1 ribonuclease R [Methylocystis sp.]MCA3586755.1 ribonuclease R [Methylocystis sp.]MCA3591004.1 ribonuclease R [Methylocystis sp.]